MKHLKIVFYLLSIAVMMNACSKEYSVEGASGLIYSTGAWQFNDSTTLFAGNMDSAYIDSSTSTHVLHLVGTSLTGSQHFELLLYAHNFSAGTYKASLFESGFVYTSPTGNIYQSGQLVGEFTVTVSAISSTLITGSFSGAVLNASNQLIQITDGKFTSSFSGNPKTGGISSGVFADSAGNCKPATLQGMYTAGIGLDSTNTVQVQVVVANPGFYTITSSQTNGVSFAGSGTFNAAGVHTVTLQGTGTPQNAGLQNFSLQYGNSQCAFSIDFGQMALGSTSGAGGTCAPITVLGTFKHGVALNANNGVQVQLSVSAPGNYSIVTPSVDGMYFYHSGTFTGTGTQVIILSGSGTPTTSGSQTFSVAFGNTNCTFQVPVQ